jgi:hypothetical protein
LKIYKNNEIKQSKKNIGVGCQVSEKARAEADQVYLSIHKQSNQIELLVKDNGRGFDLEKIISLIPQFLNP